MSRRLLADTLYHTLEPAEMADRIAASVGRSGPFRRDEEPDLYRRWEAARGAPEKYIGGVHELIQMTLHDLPRARVNDSLAEGYV